MLTFNRWIVLYCGITLTFVLLVAIPEENFVFRSVSITFIAVFSICYYLYKRYSKRLSIQADLLISINTLAQFLLPVFYLAYYYQANPHLDPWNHRYGYAVTSFAALLGQTMFFLGYESTKKSAYFPPVKTIESSLSRMFLLLFPFLVSIWAGRFILLSSGTYYHVFRSDYQFASPFYSVFAQLDGYGLIIVVALFLIAFSEENKKRRNIRFAIATIVFVLEILWYVPAGLRANTAMTVLAPLFAYIFIKRKIPKKALGVLLIAGSLLFVIMGEYRYVTAQFFRASEINLKATVPALLAASNRVHKGTVLVNVMDRFYDGRNLEHLLAHYSHDYDYELGSTYKNMPFVFVPRFIYPDKPVFTTALGNWYQLLAGTSTPTTFWGESYINFSWFGIVAMSYLLGLFMKGYDYIFIKRASKRYWVYLYVFSAIHIIRLPVEPAVVWASFLLKTIVLAFMFTQIHLFFTRLAQVDRSGCSVVNSR